MSFLQNNLEKYTVKQMCKALKFPRSTYYEALLPVPFNKEQEYQKFSAEVKQCFEKNKRCYGVVKIYYKLNEDRTPCSIQHVQRHMQRQGLCSVVVKQYNYKANQEKILDYKENVLNRDFKAETVNQKWVTDITDIYVL